MQTLSQIRALLAEHDVRPRKSMGQNFLHDPNKLRQIIAAADVHDGEAVLEVGPGTGVLTEALLEAGARVLAVELDAAMVDILRDRIGPDSDRFTLLQADALAGKRHLSPQLTESLKRLTHSSGVFKLVANLPYNIASPLLATLAADWPAMTAAIVMVQREVADRLTAAPGGKEFGPLTVIVQAMCEVERIMMLSPNCFWPKPAVESAVIKLVRRARPLTADPARLSAMLHTLFSKRRKQIGTILGRHRPLPADIDATQRPEQLTVQQLISLADSTAGEYVDRPQNDS